MTIVLLILGGAIGATVRYLTDRAVTSQQRSTFPLGTLTVNTVGCLLVGVVAASTRAGGAPSWLMILAGTGFCGALTTFSTFSLDTVRLVDDGSPLLAIANVLVSLSLGLASVVAGWDLTSLVV